MKHCSGKLVSVLASAILLCATAIGQNGGLRFTLTDLGTFGGNWSAANAINAKGQVVGTIGFGTFLGPGPNPNRSYCFLWQSGVAPVTFSGDAKPNYYCDARAVGVDGTIAGTMRTAKSDPWLSAFRRDPNGTVLNLKPLPGNGIQNQINDSWGYGVIKKTVVGMSKEQAVTWDSTGAVTALPPGGWSEARGVNGSLQIAGWVASGGWAGAGLWQNGSLTRLPVGAYWSVANAINSNGFVAMTYAHNTIATNVCVEEWFAGAMTELGCGLGQAAAISTDHWIVTGLQEDYVACSRNPDWCYQPCWPPGCGFLMVPDPSCRPTQLSSLLDASSAGWNVWSATGINDKHQIVGWGVPPSGGPPHAILLTPNDLPLCYPD